MRTVRQIFFFLLGLVIFASCLNTEERQMRKMLVRTCEVRSFSRMEAYDSVRLCDEVKEQVLLLSSKLTWDRCFYETYKEDYDQGCDDRAAAKATYTLYGEEMTKDSLALNYLDTVKTIYADTYQSVTFMIYKMPYLTRDSTGKRKHELCFGKFDRNRKMVAFKPTGTGEWEVLESGTGIHGFDEYEMPFIFNQ